MAAAQAFSDANKNYTPYDDPGVNTANFKSLYTNVLKNENFSFQKQISKPLKLLYIRI